MRSFHKRCPASRPFLLLGQQAVVRSGRANAPSPVPPAPPEAPGEEVDSRSLAEILSSIPPPPPPAMASEAGAPRLMITHIVNQNFKSYAGEKVLGPFHKVDNCCQGMHLHPDASLLVSRFARRNTSHVS